jgi:hypothetical protein
MLEDYWAHRVCEDPKAADEIEDVDFDLDDVVQAMQSDDWQEVLIGRYQDPR